MGSHHERLWRAREHLKVFQHWEREWAGDHPCGLVTQCDLKTRKEVVTVYVFARPTARFSLVLGECIHNARTSLDHLGYRLACEVYKTDPPKNEGNAGFPIFPNGEPVGSTFDSYLANKIGPKKRVPTKLRAALKCLQPYYGGDRCRLADLQCLDNIDKHHFPPLIGTGLNSFAAYDTADTLLGGSMRQECFEHGAVVPIPTEAEVDVHAHFACAIAFGKRTPTQGLPVVDTLSRTLDFIENTVFPTLDPFLT